MATVPWVFKVGDATEAGTWYCAPGQVASGYNLTNFWRTEARAAVEAEAGATLSNLALTVLANSLTTLTLRTRVGGANGNQVLSMSSVTAYEDTTNTDSWDNGEQWAIEMSATGTGSATFNSGSMLCAPTSGTFTVLVNEGTAQSDTNDWFIPVVGREGVEFNTEDQSQVAVPAGTLRNAWARAESNTRSDSVSLRARINAATGNLLLTWAAGSATDQTDVSNTDTVSANDKFNWWQDQAGGTGTLQFRSQKLEVVGTNQFLFAGSAGYGDSTITTGGFYHPVVGILTTRTTGEDYWQAKMNVAFTWSNLFVTCGGVSGGNTLTVRTRINGANGNQLTTHTAAGQQQDTTHTDAVADNDLIALSSITDSGTASLYTQSSRGEAGAASLTVDWMPSRVVWQGAPFTWKQTSRAPGLSTGS